MLATDSSAAPLRPPASPRDVRAANAPQLALLRALLTAGGGAANFRTTNLVATLAGADADGEFAALIKRFGAQAVKRSILVFDFSLADALRRLREHTIALPAVGQPDPGDHGALAAALYHAGVDARGSFTAGTLLDDLVSRPVGARVVTDVNAKFGVAVDAHYQVVLRQLMSDLNPASEP
jgi:hypothetical protein